MLGFCPAVAMTREVRQQVQDQQMIILVVKLASKWTEDTCFSLIIYFLSYCICMYLLYMLYKNTSECKKTTT